MSAQLQNRFVIKSPFVAHGSCLPRGYGKNL